jgi:hypothetical protein
LSRGLGRVERAVLAALAEGGRSTRTLAVQLYGRHPTPAQRAAMHRAVSSLERKGLVRIRRTLGGKRWVLLMEPEVREHAPGAVPRRRLESSRPSGQYPPDRFQVGANRVCTEL